MSGNSIDMHGFNPLANSYIQIPGATTNSTADVGSLFLNDMASLTNSFATMFLDNAIQSATQRAEAKAQKQMMDATMQELISTYEEDVTTLEGQLLDIETAESEYSSLESVETSLKEKIEKHKEKYEAYTKAEAEITTLEGTKKAAEQLESDIAGCDTERSAIMEDCGHGIVVNANNYTSGEDALLATVQSPHSSDDAKNAEKETLRPIVKRAIESVKSQVEQLKTKKETLESRLKAILPEGCNDSASIGNKITEKKESLTQLDVKVGDSKISDISKTLTETQQKMKECKTKIAQKTTVQNQLETKRKDLAHAKALVNREKLDKAQQDISTTSAQIDAAKEEKSAANKERKAQLKSQGKNWLERVFTGRTEGQKVSRTDIQNAKNANNAAINNRDNLEAQYYSRIAAYLKGK